ncbi:MAG: hypothetical protein ACI9FR_002504 [Cryomorphaceae bacterium]
MQFYFYELPTASTDNEAPHHTILILTMKSEKAKDTDTDGRVQRSKRSRQKIMEAIFSLNVDGVYVPIAQEVADKAGLGIRTVFRHFSDMERLFVEGDRMLYAQFQDQPNVQPAGSLEERIEQFAAIRCDNFERFAPYIRATQAQLWRYNKLRQNYRALTKIHRTRLFSFIPELEEMSKLSQDAADVAMSFESWNRLRFTQRKSKKETRTIMVFSLSVLLKN